MSQIIHNWGKLYKWPRHRIVLSGTQWETGVLWHINGPQIPVVYWGGLRSTPVYWEWTRWSMYISVLWVLVLYFCILWILCEKLSYSVLLAWRSCIELECHTNVRRYSRSPRVSQWRSYLMDSSLDRKGLCNFLSYLLSSHLLLLLLYVTMFLSVFE